MVGGTCARCQAVAVLDALAHAVRQLGGAISDIVRTRVLVRREADCEDVSHVHGRLFWAEGARPTNTTIVVPGLIGDEFLVEMGSPRPSCAAEGPLSWLSR